MGKVAEPVLHCFAKKGSAVFIFWSNQSGVMSLKSAKNWMLKEIRKNTAIYLMLLPAIFYLLIFCYYPIVDGIEMSFRDVVINSSEKNYIGWENYQTIFQDKYFWSALRNTFIFAFWNCFLGVALSGLCAVMLNEIRRPFTRRFIQTSIYLPNLLSWVVVGSSFMFMLSPTVGPVNQILQMCGQESFYFFGDIPSSRFLLIFINQWKITGYGVIIYMAAIIGISSEQYEAAIIDGVNRFQQIVYITIPNISNTIKVMLMLNIMGMFQLFDPIYILSNRITQNNTDVIMTYVYRTSLAKIDLGPGAAASVFISIIALIFTLVAKKMTKFGFEE